ncbi:MAG TPA: hypothetical protein VHV56_12295 [Pseudolabrys sp.]|jgi:hypothetical protein|nr:hypothetical protein [Pseudolabrys sp.]
MTLRREFAMLICAAGCAIALMIPAPRPGVALTGTRTLPMAADLGVGNTAANDAVMVALRLEANAALQSLQGSPSE